MQIILFDGYCNLCSSTVMFIHRRRSSTQFRFIPLQSEAGKALLTQAGIPATEQNTVIYLKDRRPYFRSGAILHILKDLGGAWQLLYVFIIIPPFIRDAIYNAITRVRYRIWGKRNTCFLPPPHPSEKSQTNRTKIH